MNIQDDDDRDNYKFRMPDEDDDGPDEALRERDTVKCPHCRKWILEDSPKCPYCKNWVEAEREGPSRPRWVVWTAIALLALCGVWWMMTAHPLW